MRSSVVRGHPSGPRQGVRVWEEERHKIDNTTRAAREIWNLRFISRDLWVPPWATWTTRVEWSIHQGPAGPGTGMLGMLWEGCPGSERQAPRAPQERVPPRQAWPILTPLASPGGLGWGIWWAAKAVSGFRV